jgi:ribonuclease Y
MDLTTILLLITAVFVLSLLAAFYLIVPGTRIDLEQTRKNAQKLLLEAQTESLSFRTHTLQQLERFKKSFEEYELRFNNQSQKSEKSIQALEQRAASRDADLQKIQTVIDQEQNEIIKLDTETQSLHRQIIPLLIRQADYPEERVKQDLLLQLDQDLELAAETRQTKYLDFLRENSTVIAKNLLIEAIHRYSASTSVEKKSLIIPINRNETKAKIIGKNCEILNFFEEKLGVNMVFDDSKPGLSISHFDLVKKHIARETILKLIKDRVVDLERAQKRLEETVIETKALLLDVGNKVVKKLDLEYRHFPDDFKTILGRLKFRTSYGQNILKHCFEVGYFTLLLGNELGLNEEICKIGGFFHDLGKAIDQEDGRPHDILTKEIMEKFQIFSWEEIHAAWTHHDSVPIETAEALLVKAGDAISAGRPGARQETIEKYLARVMAIEGIANSYEGVNKTYAISGGRELRVLVDPKKLADQNLPELAAEIAQEIEQNVAYPGQIKINVIRRVQHNRTIKDKNKKK